MIYVHFPFCKQKCVYCNFYSVASTRLKEAYWDALCKEIALTEDYLADNQIDTLYFGGGTPSLCSLNELERILNELHKHYVFNDGYEFTMECNPEQLTKDYLQGLKSLGINRLSIGVQSFDDEILRLLHRRHSAEEAKAAVLTAADSGFGNISIDLIYDIAFRTAAMWRTDLETALSLPISHLSCYSLTVEENTILARKQSQGVQYQLDECETERDFNILMEMAQAAGFEQYEISNFAKNGAISRHNHAYWMQKPYLGLGAAAHSYDGTSRRRNVPDLQRYIEGIQSGIPCAEREVLSLENQYDEYVLLRLRTREGIDLHEVERLFGAARLKYLLTELQRVKPSYYSLKDNKLKLTQEGKLFADAIAMQLMG